MGWMGVREGCCLNQWHWLEYAVGRQESGGVGSLLLLCIQSPLKSEDIDWHWESSFLFLALIVFLTYAASPPGWWFSSHTEWSLLVSSWMKIHISGYQPGQLSKAPGSLLKTQIPRIFSQTLWFNRSGVGPENLILRNHRTILAIRQVWKLWFQSQFWQSTPLMRRALLSFLQFTGLSPAWQVASGLQQWALSW